MMEIKKFVELMTGEFDNKEQFMEMKEAGKSFPYAQHINTVCNDKIKNIPEDFNGVFVVEDERVIIRTKLEKPSKIKGLALI